MGEAPRDDDPIVAINDVRIRRAPEWIRRRSASISPLYSKKGALPFRSNRLLDMMDRVIHVTRCQISGAGLRTQTRLRRQRNHRRCSAVDSFKSSGTSSVAERATGS